MYMTTRNLDRKICSFKIFNINNKPTNYYIQTGSQQCDLLRVGVKNCEIFLNMYVIKMLTLLMYYIKMPCLCIFVYLHILSFKYKI